MIIIDDQDGPFNKSADTAASSSVENVRGSERDSMLTAQRLAQQSQHYQYTIPHPEPEPLPPPYSPRNEPESDPLLPYYFQRELSTRADKRFVHALAYAALFWTVFGFLARGVFIFTSKQIQVCNFCNFLNGSTSMTNREALLSYRLTRLLIRSRTQTKLPYDVWKKKTGNTAANYFPPFHNSRMARTLLNSTPR